MENNKLKSIELNVNELRDINGGGPIKDAIDWYYNTLGSFCHGLWDGLVGNDPAV